VPAAARSPRAARALSARGCALTVVRRVFEEGAFADRALHSEAAELDPRERGFAMQLAYGTVQRRATLDYAAERLLSRPLNALEPAILAVLRLGLFQLLYLGGVADHAAVNESVELAKRSSRGGAGLVNAVLRRAAAERETLLDGLDDRSPAGAAIVHSVPEWLAELWWRELGEDAARALLERINDPAESALRVNPLVAQPDDVAAQLPIGARAAPGLPEGLVLEDPFDVHGSELWARGAIMPQSRGSMVVARILDPAPGDRVLDLCAAPGGKTTHLAALMGDRGSITAVERHPGRAQALARTCARMAATCVRVQVGDAAEFRTKASSSAGSADGFHRVLVDPPCSGLGTLQSRPDLRWHAGERSIPELAALQARILAAGAAATRPGGTLVYSVCTISRAESADVVERFMAEHDDFAIDPVGEPASVDPAAELTRADPWTGRYVQLLPHRDGTDGFFIARLRRHG
jgi:16S rRNA (cytosine967-C5)-methyltransferase